MRDMFSREVYFRNALIEIARARTMTKKNQSRMTSFHLYFIRRNIRANAMMKEKINVMKLVVGSWSGVSSPKGNWIPIVMFFCSPVTGSIIVCIS